MSKEMAAAILTQTYFQNSPIAASRVNIEIDHDKAKGTEPAAGAIAIIVKTYMQMFQTMPK